MTNIIDLDVCMTTTRKEFQGAPMAYVTMRTPETWPQAGHDNGKKRRRTVQGKKDDGSCSGRTYLKEQANENMRLNDPPRLRAQGKMQGALCM